MSYWNQLEPDALAGHFAAHPPEGFVLLREGGTAPSGDRLTPDSAAPAFAASFNLLTSADNDLKQRLRKLPLYRHWSRLLRWRTAFVGTTVSEYALLPRQRDAQALAAGWRAAWGCAYKLLIVKDLPQRSPLLCTHENALADALAEACADQGYVLLQGQALAYVVIDFPDIAAYLSRLSTSRRKNLKRKLRSMDGLEVSTVATGSAIYQNDAAIDAYYALYLAVYAQSEVHFDKLSRAFFAALLRDAGGTVFEYRRKSATNTTDTVNTDGGGSAAADHSTLIGWNLCFEVGDKLIDKYIGLAYPAAREHNLYFVSWVVNLQHAIDRGLTHYVAGWTDPEVKAQLGASFTFTRHAVFVRNPLLRALARRLISHFEGDSKRLADAPARP